MEGDQEKRPGLVKWIWGYKEIQRLMYRHSCCAGDQNLEDIRQTTIQLPDTQWENALPPNSGQFIARWPQSSAAGRAAYTELKSIRLGDLQIRLEMHIAWLANNKSPLVNEDVRTFMSRIEEQSPRCNCNCRLG